ncbi:hypothetical protein K7432_007987 [Basidiobolus ranarum]|uniref:RlpA-like protein double-psi beta-barrel domain-containing protein n=1 Tax=Basidiobolus ranarum TaxID=34480 RepID=A0ABR2VZA9_9FUNG
MSRSAPNLLVSSERIDEEPEQLEAGTQPNNTQTDKWETEAELPRPFRWSFDSVAEEEYRSWYIGRGLIPSWKNPHLILVVVTALCVILLQLFMNTVFEDFRIHSMSVPSYGQGEATYYEPGLGACEVVSRADEMVAALNPIQFGLYPRPRDSPSCGVCLNLNGPKGVVQVIVVDLCPRCKEGDLDISPAAFSQIADQRDGRVPITWSVC